MKSGGAILRAILSPAESRIVAWLPLFLWCLGIFVLSSFPGGAFPRTTIPFADKWVHFVLYAPVGWLAARALASGAGEVMNRSGGRIVLMSGLLASFYGATDEVHQLFVPMRSCSFGDWVVDTVAGLLGATLWVLGFAARNRATVLAQPQAGESKLSP